MSPLPTLPDAPERRTASDDVADALRDAIVSGQIGDHEELNQVELARHFGVSRVPVREALRRLEAEGLVVAEAHRRVIVRGQTTARISEIFEVRAVLEGYMLERAAKHPGKEYVAGLRKLLAAMDKTKNHDAWLRLNQQFHRAMLEPGDTPVAGDVVDRLSHQVERYVRRSGGVHRPREVALEHREIVDALERRAVKQAVRLLRRHILATRDRVVATLPPDPTDGNVDGNRR